MRNAGSRFARSAQCVSSGFSALANRLDHSASFGLLPVTILFIAALIFTPVASAERSVVGTYPFDVNSFGTTNPGAAGRFDQADAIAVNAGGTGGASAGDLYVADDGSNARGGRISQFSTAGDFIRLWGRDVVAKGPDDSSETQQVMVKATAGTFTLSFGGKTTSPLSWDATAGDVQNALEDLDSIGSGNVIVAGGPGNAAGTQPYLVTFTGDESGLNEPLMHIDTSSLSGEGWVLTDVQGKTGFEVCEPNNGDTCQGSTNEVPQALGNSLGGPILDPESLTVNQSTGDVYAADGNIGNRIDQYTGTGQFVRAFGYDVVASGPDDSSNDAVRSVTVKANGGAFTLTVNSSCPTCNQSTTAPIPFDATPGAVGAALNSLAAITTVGGKVSVTGGPGEASGSNPYLITFGGSFSGDVAPPLSASAGSALSGGLTNSLGSSSVTTGEVTEGGGMEICNTPVDVCKYATSGSGAAFDSINGPKALAIAPNGDVVATDPGNRRVEEFTDDGDFVRAFGQDVVASGPGDSSSNEQQLVTLDSNTTGGEFSLQFNDATTGATGTGRVASSPASQTITNVNTSAGSFEVGQVISGAGIPAGTTITAVDNANHTLDISAAPTSGGSGTEQTLNADSIAYNAPATDPGTPGVVDSVEEALNALSTIGGVGGSVSVSGSPGGPYTVTFGGTLGGDDVSQMTSSVSGLTVSSGSKSVSVTTPTEGGAYEVCTASSACKPGTSGTGTGQFSSTLVGVAVDSSSSIYTVEGPGAPRRMQKFSPAGGLNLTPSLWGPSGTVDADSPTGVAIGSSDQVYVQRRFPADATTCPDGTPSPAETRVQEYSTDGTTLVDSSEACSPDHAATPATTLSTAAAPSNALALNAASGQPYLLNASGPGRVLLFGTTGADPSLVFDTSIPTQTSATVRGTINPNGPGITFPYTADTQYVLEYKKQFESTWTTYTPENPVGRGTSPVSFQVDIGGLTSNTLYDARVIVRKPFVSTKTFATSFTTLPAPPEINSVWASDVTSHSAVLHASVNPQGTDTTVHFNFGPIDSYGQVAPVPSQGIGSSLSPQTIAVPIDNLQSTTYHFQAEATNALGTVKSSDQTFNFYPPNCPNNTVRQQTNAAYLPDCRGYELVSPENAAGTTLYTGGPQSAYATNPPRLAFAGQFGEIPGAGAPINTIGDLYIATRSDTAWSTKYIGPSPAEAGCAGGRPITTHTGYPTTDQNDVFATQSLDRIIDWNLGNPVACVRGLFEDLGFNDLNTAAVGSNAPYVWNATGQFMDRWPTEVGDVPGSADDFACPQNGNSQPVAETCTTHVTASGDLNHFVFSTQSGLYGGGGLTSAPGSAYDNDTVNNTLALISELPSGGPIPQDPNNEDALGSPDPTELIQFPGVSADGSHILMGTAIHPQCVEDYLGLGPDDASCPIINQPTHLYMRVNRSVTYDVSDGIAVKFWNMTPDGSRVYFSTVSRLTPDDTDSSVDLYMWRETPSGGEITRVSAGSGGRGNSDNCVTTWTTKCDVEPFNDSEIASAPGNLGGLGSWFQNDTNPGHTDNAVAADSGDVYFYSPDQLEAGRGAPSQINLYVFRQGQIQHVATLQDDPYCIEGAEFGQRPGKCSDGTALGGDFGVGARHCAVSVKQCLNGSVGRLQVTPNGRFAAFITTTQLTTYDNHGFAEMYRYDADSRHLVCVSCRPSGESPTSEVFGSMGGRFITDDGRVFFDTAEPLDPRDSNGSRDVYEYVDGRPQLITTGTGIGGSGFGFTSESVPGLYGVSGDGVDVYFGTTDTLVGQDRNGNALKFYDARTNGGFPFNPPVPPCKAADECHGPSSQGSPSALFGTTAELSGGNAREGRCAILGHRTQQAVRRANALRRKAKHSGHSRAAGLRHRATKILRESRHQQLKAKHCRHVRQAGHTGGAGR